MRGEMGFGSSVLTSLSESSSDDDDESSFDSLLESFSLSELSSSDSLDDRDDLQEEEISVLCILLLKFNITYISRLNLIPRTQI